MEESKRGLWPCARPTCDQVLGRIAYGEFVWEKGVEGSTDGANVIFRCPKCEMPKVWFSKPQARFMAAMESLASEIAKQVQRLNR